MVVRRLDAIFLEVPRFDQNLTLAAGLLSGANALNLHTQIAGGVEQDVPFGDLAAPPRGLKDDEVFFGWVGHCVLRTLR
jgi:hypothetical protein